MSEMLIDDEPALRFDDPINAEIVGMVRSQAERVTGGNMSFADDDLNLLSVLAARAVLAGLHSDMKPGMQAKMTAACELLRADIEDGFGGPVPRVAA